MNQLGFHWESCMETIMEVFSKGGRSKGCEGSPISKQLNVLFVHQNVWPRLLLAILLLSLLLLMPPAS